MKKRCDANHEELACGFDSMAVDERSRVSRFRRMATQYESMGGSAIARWRLDRHCKDLAATAEKMAGLLELLATAHRAMAAEARGR